jgi:hypothetical protein
LFHTISRRAELFTDDLQTFAPRAMAAAPSPLKTRGRGRALTVLATFVDFIGGGW